MLVSYEIQDIRCGNKEYKYEYEYEYECEYGYCDLCGFLLVQMLRKMTWID